MEVSLHRLSDLAQRIPVGCLRRIVLLAGREMALTVLLVEDEGLVLEMLKWVFEDRGDAILTAKSGKEAVAALQHGSFDLVLTDMRMETSTSGFEVIRAAKALENPPVVFILSAYALPSAAWRDSGADGIYMKGRDLDRMLEDLDKLVQRRLRKPARRSSLEDITDNEKKRRKL
jgi:two-component system, NtrC family, response regulator PilR